MDKKIYYTQYRPGRFDRMIKHIINSSLDSALITVSSVLVFSLMSLSVGVVTGKKLEILNFNSKALEVSDDLETTNITTINKQIEINSKFEQERLLTLFSEMNNLKAQRDSLLAEKRELASLVKELPEINQNKKDKTNNSDNKLNGQGGSISGLGKLFSLANKNISSDNSSDKNLTTILHDEHELTRLISKTPIGAPVLGRLTSEFGVRKSPFSEFNEESNSINDFHTGIDIAAEINTPVVSSIEGEVFFSGRKGTYGKTVIIKNDRNYETLYAHLSKITVKTGDKVKRGQKIGLVGSSGRSTGPHLHYEIKHLDNIIDPKPFIEFANKIP